MTSPTRPVPPTEKLRVVQQAAQLALQLAQRLQDNFANHASHLELTGAQAKVLIALEPDRPIAQRTLADQLGFDPSNLTGLIDKLEDLGAVQRTATTADRRVKMVALTTSGQKRRQDFLVRLTTDAGPLAHLTAPQVRSLRDILAKALEPHE